MTDIIWTQEKRHVTQLRPWEKNPRRINKDQYQRLIESLKASGYANRLLINTDNTIAGGHQRLKALKELGYKEIDVLVPNRLLTEQEFKRVVISDNISAGEFDFEILGNEFELQDLVDWGFPEKLLDLGEPLDTDEDEPIAVSTADPICKPGDIWQLGNHRLMCGDSTNATTIELLLQGERPNLMVTDPPYGIDYKPEWREHANLGGGQRSKGLVTNDTRVDWTEAYSLFPGEIAYIWHSSLHTHTIAQNLIDCGYKLVSSLVWVKQHFALSRGDYHWQHESCWYAVKQKCKHNWQGARDQATIWEIANNNSFGNAEKEETWGHSTQKPIECMLRPILNNSAIGDWIYDPFGGSGTTLIAAEKSGRKCLMIELEPKYCDVIITRWEKLTQQKAILSTTQIASTNLTI